MRFKARCLVPLLLVAAILVGSAVVARADDSIPAPETKEQRDARMKWWREARFGMFIHWGIYSVPAGTYHDKQIPGIGEWIMNRGKIPVAEYAGFAKEFDPEKFDAETWVKLAKGAGMKYIVITSKHHDGFAMFGSKTSPYNIVDATPYKHDPLKDLAAACQKEGIKLGFYYSQAQDWHHPGGAASGGHWDPAQEGDFDQYLKTIAVPQVKEILTNYGPIAVLWWDTPVNMNKERAEQFLPLLKLQPGLITNNRLVHGVPEIQGDTETPEQYIPATGYPGRDFEVCMTMNDTWGFKSYDNNWKSTEKLIRNLIDIASKGGNYLLNVGPTREGLIPDPSVERLKQIGEWMSKNGEAIYGTTASPFRRYSFDGRVTTKGDKLYVHVFDFKNSGAQIVGLKSAVKSAKYLADGTTAQVKSGKDENGAATVTIAPPASPDPIATVIELQLDGPPQVDPTAGMARAAGDGSFELRAADANLEGRTIKLEESEGVSNVGYWTNRRDMVAWDFAPKSAGDYTVEVSYACPDASAGSQYTVSVGDAKVSGKVDPTGGWDMYRTAKLADTLHIGAGPQTLTVKPTSMPKDAVMNLRSVKLVPVKQT